MNSIFTTTILVVDSDEQSRDLLVPFLKTLGFARLHVCQDVEEALSLVHTIDVHMILADWTLPGLTGFDALTSLRQNHQYDDIKIVLMIREGESVNILEGMRAGMNGYIMKPFSTRNVQQKIEAVLQSSRILASSTPSSCK